MNAATANPEIDIAYGKEPREFLAQSMGFENELIGQSNSPNSHRCEARFAHDQFLPPAGSPRRLGNPVPDVAASGPEYAVNSTAYARWKAGHPRCATTSDWRAIDRLGREPDRLVGGGRQRSTHATAQASINGILTRSRIFIEYSSLRPIIWRLYSRSDFRRGL
jgi:hypothetical protein